jgi:hypothetical protein
MLQTMTTQNIDGLSRALKNFKAGAVFGSSRTSFASIRERQQQRELELWAPFETKQDWEFAKWIIESGTGNKDVDKLLKLESVHHPEPCKF